MRLSVACGYSRTRSHRVKVVRPVAVSVRVMYGGPDVSREDGLEGVRRGGASPGSQLCTQSCHSATEICSDGIHLVRITEETMTGCVARSLSRTQAGMHCGRGMDSPALPPSNVSHPGVPRAMTALDAPRFETRVPRTTVSVACLSRHGPTVDSESALPPPWTGTRIRLRSGNLGDPPRSPWPGT